MEFNLEISTDNLNYDPVDLFPDQQLEYDLDFYDSLEVDKVKLPFYTKLRIPLTDNNKASNRFNFDPQTSSGSAFPRDDFYFRITVEGVAATTISGILNVVSFEYNSSAPIIEVELKDYLSKYISEIKDLPFGTIYNDSYYTTAYAFTNFDLPTGTLSGEAGTLNTNPDYSRPIAFPYVDFCNDVHGKFGYAARQFLEYGPGMNRTGLNPVFSLRGFLTLLGSYISNANFPVRVDSHLFGMGSFTTPAFKELEPEKIQMLLPAYLLAKKETNTRNFFVRQSPAWTGTNESLESCTDISGNPKLIHTGWFGNMETAGNYGTDAEGNPLYATPLGGWGAEKGMGFYPDDNDEGIRGFFAPKVSFNAAIELLNGGSAKITNPKIEIPVVQEDKMVVNLVVPNVDSTMTFKAYVSVYEDGLMVRKIPLQDVNGDDIILGMSDVVSVTPGNSNKSTGAAPFDFFMCDDGHEGHGAIIGVGANYTDMLQFSDFDAYLPAEELFINQGSQYSVNYFIEPFDGDIRVEYADSYTHGASYHTVTTTAQGVFSVNDLRKVVTRIDSYNELNLNFVANQDFLPYLPTDQYVIQDSILDTCPYTVSEVFSAILKRFDCGVFYDYDSSNSEHILRIDPLLIARSGTQNINEDVDDLKSVKMFSNGDKIKTLAINNKDFNGFYDDLDNDGVTIGSITQDINTDGISEYKIDLESSVYFRSVCGGESADALSESNFGAFSEKELGITPNIFTPNKDIGLRFAYLDKPIYKTNLLRSHVKLKGDDQSGKMTTESQVIYNKWKPHTFNGRLFPFNVAGWDLRFQVDGTPTDIYTQLFRNSEKIVQSESAMIEFDIVIPTSELANLNFFLQRLNATRITSNGIYVKSAKGDVYEDFAYLTIQGILK